MTEQIPRDPTQMRVSLRTEAGPGAFGILARDGTGVMQTIIMTVLSKPAGLPPWDESPDTENYMFALAPPDAQALAQQLLDAVGNLPTD